MIAAQRERTPSFFALLTLPATAMGLALSVQVSVLSWMLSTRFGLKVEEIGLVWAAGPVAGILGQVAIGGLSDRAWVWNGRRRVFIIAGGAVAALAMLLLPQIGVVAHALGLASVLGVAVAVALALDLAVNVGFNPTRALIADVTRAGAERTRAFSLTQVISGGFGVGAYAIGALFGNYTLIYVAVALVLLFAVVPTLLIAEPRTIASDVGAQAGAGWSVGAVAMALLPLWAILVYDLHGVAARLLGTAPVGHFAEWLCAGATLLLVAYTFLARADAGTPFRRIMAAGALTWLGVQPIFVYMVSVIHGRMPGLDAGALGRVTSIAFLALNGVAALAPLLLGRLAARHGAVPVHVAALASMAAGCFGVWLFAATPIALYALMALCGIGWGSIVSLPFAIMSEHVDARRIGLFMGLFNLSVVLPQLVSSLGVGSFIAAAPDKGLVFALSGGCLGLSALLWSRCDTRGVGE